MTKPKNFEAGPLKLLSYPAIFSVAIGTLVALMSLNCAKHNKEINVSASLPLLDPNLAIHYIGRFQPDAAGPVFEWSNSAIFGQFSGTGISVTLEELQPQVVYSDNIPAGNTYQVSVDNGVGRTIVAQPGTTTYELAVGLVPGNHTVKITKMTEARVGGTRFLGFKVADGQLEPRLQPEARRMLVIGDSISAGYGVLGADPNCSFTPGTEDSTKSYGAVAADILNAELTVTAWSAKGVWRNEDGNSIDTMSQLYLRTLPSEPTSTWDFNSWIPDAIVINLGTNDFAVGSPPSTPFQQAYASMLTNLRITYPGARIFCALGPMLSDTIPPGGGHLSTARNYIQNVLQAKNDSNIEFIEFSGLTAAQQGCGGHPKLSFQLSMGKQLAQTVQTALHW